MKRYLVILSLSAALASFGVAAANACGVVGCALEQILPNSGVGETLDSANNACGNCFDKAAEAAAAAAAAAVGM
jgi:hypothetical protein